MAWVLLIFAGVFEVVWALALPSTRGFTRLWPSVFTLAMMGVSFWLLATSVKTIPIGLAYPVWVGIGAAGAYVVSMVLLKESFRPLPAACVAMIVLGVIGLKVSGTKPAQVNGVQAADERSSR